MHPAILFLALIITTPEDVRFHPGCEALIEDQKADPADVGDRRRLGWDTVDGGFRKEALVSDNRLDLADYFKASSIRDVQGGLDLRRSGRVFDIPYGTPCLVLDEYEVPMPRNKTQRLLAVRVLEGPFKGQRLYCASYAATVMITKK